MNDLRFGGSIWCNIDIALRQIQTVYDQEIELIGLKIIEWYVLQTLYEQDGQMASRLADAVGRPATSFTPILDSLQAKGFIERRPHSADRRAIRVYLTEIGRVLEEQVKTSVAKIETNLRQKFSDLDWERFQKCDQGSSTTGTICKLEKFDIGFMNHFYVIIENDGQGELVYTPTHHTLILEAFAATGIFLMWGFEYEGHRITIYAGTLSALPVGENREEIERRVLMALNLI